jgi:tRNA_anti-like
MNCPKCSLRMPGGTLSCPNCGWSKSSPVRKFAIGLGVVIAVIYVIGKVADAGSSSSTSTSSASAAAEPEAPAAPPIEVNARTLFKEYDANEVSADDSYKGKRLRVTGTVTAIAKDLFDHIIVRMAGANAYQTVDATMLPNEKSNAARLSKGVVATVICTGGGKMVGSPMLEDCAFAR